jgi:opacity protein-like surface antigen
MKLDLSRLRGADRLVAVAALALALFVFAFDWFGENIGGKLPGNELTGAGGSLTGWQAFTHSRWMWLATVVVALASVLVRAAAVRLPDSVKPGSVVALLGVASVVLIAYRLVHHPAANGGFAGFHVTLGIEPGIWLGLVAAVAVAAGGYLQLRAETVRPQADTGSDEQPAEGAFTGLTVAASPSATERSSAASAPSRPPSAGAPSDAPGDGA